MQKVVEPAIQELIIQLQEYEMLEDYAKLKECTERLKDLSEKKEDVYGRSMADYYFAVYGGNCNDLLKAKTYCLKVKEQYPYHQSHLLYALTCKVEGILSVLSDERQNALCYFLEGYRISNKYNLSEVEVQILNNIGSIFYALQKYEKALEYYLKAYETTKRNPVPEFKSIGIIFMNIMNCYIRKEEFEDAKIWEERCKEYVQAQPNKNIEFSIVINQIVMNYKQKTKKEMKILIDQFLEYKKEIIIDFYVINSVFEVIQCCLERKEIDMCQEMIQIAEKILANTKSDAYKEKLSSVKVQLYDLMGDKNAVFYELQKYHRLVQKGLITKRENEYLGLLSQIRLEQEKHSKKQMELKNEELKKRNEIDSFTGLFNKITFEKKVKERLRKKGNKDVLLLIDVDNFKRINDTHGHMIGDWVLKQIANKLKEKTRHSDYVGRIGGDEFCALLLNIVHKEDIEVWIQTLLESIREISSEKVKKGSVTVSIGAATTKGSNTSITLFEKADKAMYEAKKNGKNTYEIY